MIQTIHTLRTILATALIAAVAFGATAFSFGSMPAMIAYATPNTVTNTDTSDTFTGSSAIQDAIDDENTLDGHTLEIGDGVYAENVNITKELTVQSENGNMSTTIEGSVNIMASNTTLDGFTITQGSPGDFTVGVTVNDGPYTNVTIQNNHITGIDNPSTNSTGVWVTAGSNISILNNEIDNISADDATAQGILIGGTSEPDTTSNVTVEENMIHDITGDPGAFGIMVNESSSDLIVRDNIFRAIHGEDWMAGTGLDNPTENALIEGNNFSDLTTGGTPVAVSVNESEGNTEADSITVRQNNFFFSSSTEAYGVFYTPSPEASPNVTVNAEENYWNTPEGPGGPEGESGSNGALVGPDVDYIPWLCEPARSNNFTATGDCDPDETTAGTNNGTTTVVNNNDGMIDNSTSAGAHTGGNIAGGSTGGDGARGGNVSNNGGDDANRNMTGRGGNGGNGGNGGTIRTGNAQATSLTSNLLNSNIIRINRCDNCGNGDGDGNDVTVRNNNTGSTTNMTGSRAGTGLNWALGSLGGNGGHGGDVGNSGGGQGNEGEGEESGDDANGNETGNGGRGGDGSRGGLVNTGHADAWSETMNDLNRTDTRIVR